MSNKLIIAAAGSGKTTYLVNEALKLHTDKVLITTFTEANELEIRKKFIEVNGYIPDNIVIQTWFSLLLQHGVKPYQSMLYEGEIKGLLLVNQKSGFKYIFKGNPVYFAENDVKHHYFNNSMQIYSDKLSKYVCKVNEKTGGLVIDRLSRIFPNIFIDEIQDLAGYDLEIIRLILQSNSKLLMVGDPRQVTYHTHEEAKYSKYCDGKIEQFINEQCSCLSVEIDKTSLNITHRNQNMICCFANNIYPSYEPCKADERKATGHDGVFFINPSDVDEYLKRFNPIQLRDKITVNVNDKYKAMNFGDSKGLTFERVIIYPTNPMIKWILNHDEELAFQSRSKFYVAVTRAIHSVAIIFDNKKGITVDGIQNYKIYS